MSGRIVITGMGWITPLGHDIESVWRALLAAHSGTSAIQHFDASTYPTTFAAQVKGYDWRPYVQDPELHREIGLNTSFALGAARQAWTAAGLDEFEDIDLNRLGIYLGSGEGSIDFNNYVNSNLDAWNDTSRSIDVVRWAEVARQRLRADREIEQEPNMPLAHLALEFQAMGPAYNCLTACAASTQAIGEATEILRRGDADLMITGGAHTMIHPFGVTGFNRLTALSTRNSDPAGASRPFSRDRDGFVLGEGAGIIILETLEHAEQRGATPLAEIAGYGSIADAHRITDIHPEGRGAAQAMWDAITDAAMTPNQIDYISAHGTGTKENDSIESKAIRAVFGSADSANHGSQGRIPPISSIKSILSLELI